MKDGVKTVTCPYCHRIFSIEYYEQWHVPCPEPSADTVLKTVDELWPNFDND